MKKQILTLAVAVTLGTTACTAQDGKARMGRPEGPNHMERLISDLGLTEAQATEFREIMEDAMAGGMGPKGGPGMGGGPMGQRGQRGGCCCCCQGQMGGGPGMGGCPMPGGPEGAPGMAEGQGPRGPEGMPELTEEQREEMKAKMDSRREELQAKREEMEAKAKETDERLKSLLTDEQYAKLAKMRGFGHGKGHGPSLMPGMEGKDAEGGDVK